MVSCCLLFALQLISIKAFQTRLVAPALKKVTMKGSVVIIRELPGGGSEEVVGNSLDLATELGPQEVKKAQKAFLKKVRHFAATRPRDILSSLIFGAITDRRGHAPSHGA